MKLCLLLSLLVTLISGQSLVSPPPRDCREQGFEGGGPASGSTLPQYEEGEVMLVKANLAAANGNFEFYLCPEVDPDSEECLLRIPLEVEEEENQFDLSEITIAGLYEINLRLPEGITCEVCVLKWVMSINECSEDDDNDCITLRDTVCADISIVRKSDRKLRVWDFVKKAFGHAMKGAAQEMLDR
ncbi:uncharacterized protein [Macrobrachium rosenbergii]|uniref:uncharacterized protein n=1 Tax=Macrobrachium rosenbergii TaxID=79674 RepID=UPI0034D499A5